MNLQNIKNLRKKDSGFTIVELLIVIVIIGILAALVIVAYTGIQNRARSTKYYTDAQTIVKKAEAYAADDASNLYPSSTTATFGSTSTSSLPTGYAVSYVTTAPTSSSTLATAAEANPKTYSVKSCNTAKGLRVYYADVTNNTVKTTDAGDVGTSC